MVKIAIVQGRLTSRVGGRYQHFPIHAWRDEFAAACIEVQSTKYLFVAEGLGDAIGCKLQFPVCGRLLWQGEIQTILESTAATCLAITATEQSKKTGRSDNQPRRRNRQTRHKR